MLREASSQPRSQKHRPRWSGVATACSALEQLCHPEQSIFQPLKTQGKAHHAGGRLLRVQITCALLPNTAACFARIKSVSLANILVLAQHSPKRDFWLVFTVRHQGRSYVISYVARKPRMCAQTCTSRLSRSVCFQKCSSLCNANAVSREVAPHVLMHSDIHM